MASSRIRPVLLIDEAQEMSPDVLGELRILSSADFDATSLLTVVLSGDGRLLELLRQEDLVPLGSRIRTRLVTEAASREELLELLRHALSKAGNATLMTAELMDTLVDHSAGNYRVLMIMGGELLAYGMAQRGRAARREVLPGGLSAEAATPRAQEESEGVKMPVTVEQPLPVVRVGEIQSRGERPALACGRALGCAVGRRDRRRPQVRQDLAGAGHGPLSVATGTACLGKYAVPEPGPVLVYLAEDALPVVRERIEGMARHRGLDLARVEIHVITAPVLRLDRDPDRTRLWETTRRLRPRLLLLDPLVRLHGIDENNAGEVAELLAYFRSLQRQLDLSVLLVHHTRKNAAGGAAAGQGLRGSSDIHAFGDSNLYLRRTKEHLVLSSEHRAAPASPPVSSGAGRDRRRRRPTWRSSRELRADGRQATQSRGASARPSGRGVRAHASEAPRLAWRSRTSVWARCWSRWSEPAGSAARPLVGNAWTDHPRRAVPVPHREKRERNGPRAASRAVHRVEEQPCQASTSTEFAPRSRWSKS